MPPTVVEQPGGRYFWGIAFSSPNYATIRFNRIARCISQFRNLALLASWLLQQVGGAADLSEGVEFGPEWDCCCEVPGFFAALLWPQAKQSHGGWLMPFKHLCILSVMYLLSCCHLGVSNLYFVFFLFFPEDCANVTDITRAKLVAGSRIGRTESYSSLLGTIMLNCLNECSRVGL